MKLLVFRSLWTNGFDLPAALSAPTDVFDGVEGPLPENRLAREEFVARLREGGRPFIAEIVTGGGYVPSNRSPVAHLDEFKRKVEQAQRAAPLHLTVLAGCDAWPIDQSVAWHGQALEFARAAGLSLSFETHRSRPTFNPWATAQLLEQLPALRLTCDFSHWCCVTERLVLDEEWPLLQRCAERADHLHARVGYEQGPQVPHPAAPEYAAALAAHERWWDTLWNAQQSRGRPHSTLTPEFGPDGYLQAAPFTQAPAADLDEVNTWMAQRQRARFSHRAETSAAVTSR